MRSLRAVTGTRDAPIRKMQRESRSQPKHVIPQFRVQRRKILHDRGWENFIASSTTEREVSAQHIKKNAEATTRAYDLNQQTLQALDTLAEEYEAFEVTMKKVAFEHEEGDVLYAMASEVVEELDRAHEEQERLQYEVEFTCECCVTASSWALHNAACENVNVTSAKLNGAFREVSNRRATHEAVRAEVKASQRTSECKRKAMEAHESVVSHRERTQRITNEHTRAKAAETWDAASKRQPRSLTCGVPDRESNEIRYLKQATEVIEEWQNLVQGVPPVRKPSSEHGEVVLIERQR